jgi:uncharacterized membrane protein YhaH (DUF805 family)
MGNCLQQMNAAIKKMLKFLFNSEGRMSRKQFCVITAYGFCLASIFLVGLIITPDSGYYRYIKFMFFILFIFHIVIFGIINQIAVIKRLHDLGVSGEDTWKLSIPIKGGIMHLSLCFEKGQRHDNQYGPTTWSDKELQKTETDSLKKRINELTIKKANYKILPKPRRFKKLTRKQN